MVILEHEDYKVIKIEPEMVGNSVEIIAPLLSLSVPYISGFQTLDQLLETMAQGIRPWQLWVILKGNVVHGAFITTLEKEGNDLLVNFEILAGLEAKEWIWPLVEKFEQYMAFMYNCTGSRVIGRKGWEKFLKNYGYVPTHYITTKKFLPQLLEPPFEQKKLGVING
jgi:hypothetical protein